MPSLSKVALYCRRDLEALFVTKMIFLPAMDEHATCKVPSQRPDQYV